MASEYRRMTYSEMKREYPDSWIALTNFEDHDYEICGDVVYVCKTIKERSNYSEKLINDNIRFNWIYTNADEGIGLLWGV
ncbi:MAG: hypothetical protein IJ661_10465 [Lachnospiraceae bacterium]|nr:hypothetical protein [Lachnospiraceae bacterium]